jgi:hypothetical protein
MFKTADNANTFRDMSAYKNGTLEFWARTTLSSANLQNYFVGIQTSTSDYVLSLASLNLMPNNNWQKITINLSRWNVSNDAILKDVKCPFLMTINNAATSGGVVDIDQIIWRKPNAAASWSAKLVKVSTAPFTSYSYTPLASNAITWTITSLPGGWKVADQYIELKIDSVPGNNWGIQIFSNAVDGTNTPKYSGTVSTSTAWGLIDTKNPMKMLPMAWRVTDKVLPFVGYYYKPDGKDAVAASNQTLELAYTSSGTLSDGATKYNSGLYDSGTLGKGYEIDEAKRKAWQPWFFLKDKKTYLNDTKLREDDYTIIL